MRGSQGMWEQCPQLLSPLKPGRVLGDVLGVPRSHPTIGGRVSVPLSLPSLRFPASFPPRFWLSWFPASGSCNFGNGTEATQVRAPARSTTCLAQALAGSQHQPRVGKLGQGPAKELTGMEQETLPPAPGTAPALRHLPGRFGIPWYSCPQPGMLQGQSRARQTRRHAGGQGHRQAP